MEVPHAVERRSASAKLEETSQNEAVYRARASRAEKASPSLQKRLKKMMTEKVWLTLCCDELVHVNQCVSALEKKTKKLVSFAWRPRN